jgi:uncharacterized protein YjbI with pentapeptide repeats
MADEQYLNILKQGVGVWNNWKETNNNFRLDLSGAILRKANLSKINFMGVNLHKADLSGANLSGADLFGVNLSEANLYGTNLHRADLTETDFREADLSEANLSMANLYKTDLSETKLFRANLISANLYKTRLIGASLIGMDLSYALLIQSNFSDANLDDCLIYGISAWGVNLTGASQSNLIITDYSEPRITVDNLEVAQFVYLLLNNQKIRDVINTISSKAVLILGQFSERKNILDAIRDGLRNRGYLPIVFDFERPTQRDFTETVMTLAGMCHFIIADITKPRSVPLELQATVPNYMIPFVPIIQKGEQPFSMFRDFWQKHREWVLDPLRYNSVTELVGVLDQAVIEPANQRRDELEARKAEKLIFRDIKDYK